MSRAGADKAAFPTMMFRWTESDEADGRTGRARAARNKSPSLYIAFAPVSQNRTKSQSCRDRA
jgi:hypothetical protein